MKRLVHAPFALLLSAAIAQVDEIPIQPCPLLGPAFPKPTNVAKAQSIIDAAKNITDAIAEALSSGSTDNESTAFSITAFSTSDSDNAPFFMLHHTPSSIALGVANVTGDSVYRIGSVSKVLTVYILLVANGYTNWLSPITDFIPELRADSISGNATGPSFWEEVTIEALASHLSGIGGDCTSS
jgi:CubicO group peptidase (beta-lactamase class C family)